MNRLLRKLGAELSGTAVLVAVVVGSGIMGTALSPDTGIALLINMFSTVSALGLLIFLLGPLSGAHFNPVVSLVMLWRRAISFPHAAFYTVAQVIGGILGALLANAMFDQKVVQTSTHVRSSSGLFIGEIVATAGLVTIIVTLIDRTQATLIPIAVPAWIASAYLFTSSTSFANPAVTIGRIFSNTFAGIAPASVATFVLCQCAGAALGIVISKTLTRTE